MIIGSVWTVIHFYLGIGLWRDYILRNPHTWRFCALGTWNFTAVSRVRTGILLQQNMTGKESLLWDKWDGDFTTWGRNLPPEAGEQWHLSSASQAANVGDQLPVKPVLCWLRQVHLLTLHNEMTEGPQKCVCPCPSSLQAVLLQRFNTFLMSPPLSGALYIPLQCKMWFQLKEIHFCFQLKLGRRIGMKLVLGK